MTEPIALKFKTLSGKRFDIIGVNVESKVGSLKEQIQEEQGFPSDLQKLIHMGKVLKDGDSLSSYNIKNNAFMVCMVGKKRQRSPEPSSESALPPVEEEPEADPIARLRLHPDLVQLRHTFQADGSIAAVLDAFQRWDLQCIHLIHAHQGLFLDMLHEPLTSEETAEVAATIQQDIGGLQQFMQNMSPEMLSAATGIPAEQLEGSLPAMMNLVQGLPPQSLHTLLNQAVQSARQLAQIVEAPPERPSLSEEDEQAVARIAELGFPHSACEEAYIVCGRDENAAAEFLFSNPPSS